MSKIRIGTRGSPLALAQVNEVRGKLAAAHKSLAMDDIEIVPIQTTGDKSLDRSLFEKGGKGLFTKEIEEHLIAGRVDLAVHSTKDMPVELPEGLVLCAFLEREDARDVLISKTAKSIADLPEGALVGTSSLRRQAQILKIRPDIIIKPIRGNVETRLAKITAGDIDATILAMAGLKRLALENEITTVIPPEEMLPAPGQGVICLQIRNNDEEIKRLLAPLNHGPSMTAVLVERAVSKTLGASCRMPLAAHATIEDNIIHARAALFRTDGSQCWAAKNSAVVDAATALGKKLGEEILSKADPAVLQEFAISKG